MRLLRFVSARLGGMAEGDRFLRDVVLRCLREPDKLRRGECLPAWLDRKALRSLGQWIESRPRGDHRAERSRREQAEFVDAMRLSLRALLRGLEPRYEHVLRRVDFSGESKLIVARELNLSRSTMDVLLHRARRAMRRRLERLCASDGGATVTASQRN